MVAEEQTAGLIAADLGLRRGGRAILDGVSLAVGPGRVLAVLGPNGAGKSSLLSVLSGWWEPDGGNARLGGRDVFAMDATERARWCAVMRQSLDRPAGVSVIEAIALGRLAWGEKARVAEELAWRMAERMDLGSLADRDCAHLSGGEWQRVAFARTVAQIWREPAGGVLLLDEPVSSLDLAHQHQLLAEARRLSRLGVAVLAVLHDLTLAAHYADDALVLRGGRVRASGPAADVLRPELLSEVFECRVEAVPSTLLEGPAYVSLARPAAH